MEIETSLSVCVCQCVCVCVCRWSRFEAEVVYTFQLLRTHTHTHIISGLEGQNLKLRPLSHSMRLMESMQQMLIISIFKNIK